MRSQDAAARRRERPAGDAERAAPQAQSRRLSLVAPQRRLQAGPTRSDPRRTVLFRAVALLTRFQLGAVLRRSTRPSSAVLLFVFSAGACALGIISAAAYLTRLPLLFPPLGPSAFILFSTPMSDRAAPRTLIFGHALSVGAGLVALHAVQVAWPGPSLLDPQVLNGARIVAIAVAMALASLLMLSLRCPHPPAAASALLAAMGYLDTPLQVAGLLGAVVLLAAAAWVFNRLIGGLPYPHWRADPRVSRMFGALAGIPAEGSSYWHRLGMELTQRGPRPGPSAR